ncbi:MAG: tetratricopeptide repeat protein [Verrucomicrobiales bacterium]|nr:tetratricopeptide repeat protein [Verrucomicrobiales bacterium]
MKYQNQILAGIVVVLSSCSQEPVTGDKEMRQGIALFKNDEIIEALDLFQSAAGKPLNVYESWELHNYIGSCYLKLEKFEEALATYDQSLAAHDGSEIVWVNKGVALRKMDRLSEAEECYLKALELNPNYAELHSSLGCLCIVRDKPEEAVDYFERAIKLKPGLASTHGNYAIALGMLGNFEAAEAQLEKAARLGYANVNAVKNDLKAMKSSSAKSPDQ